jgi:hypothetical protein
VLASTRNPRRVGRIRPLGRTQEGDMADTVLIFGKDA